jgi:hypothetical protein
MEKTETYITLYLAFYMLVCSLLGFSFYRMLQPRHIPSVGLAAYKPPIAAVVGYDPIERFVYIRSMAIEDGSYEAFEQTTLASRRGLEWGVTEAGHN